MSSLSTTSLTSGSGLDVDSVVSQLIDVERAPEKIWQAQQQLLQQQASALTSLNTKLGLLDTTMDSLKDVMGVFSKNIVTSSDESVLSATADSTAVAAQHSVVVTNLASKASFYSNALASSSTTIASGSFSIKVGTADAVAITVDSTTNTLDKLATKINGLALGVTATVINDANGARLTVNGNATGNANAVTLSAVSGFTFTQSSAAGNAKVSVDGIPIESATNVVANAIPGVTLQLQNDSDGKAITVNVTPDKARVSQALSDFVTNFNSIVSYLNSQFHYDATNQTIGVLSGDSSVRVLQQQLLGMISYSTKDNGNLGTLGSLGVTMENDGTLKLDSTKFNDLMQSNFDGVKSFFQGANYNGFANTTGDVLTGLTSTKGPINIDLQGNKDTQTAITRQIEDFELHIDVRRQQLLDQYSRVDAILRQFPLTQAQVTAQLNSIASTK